MADMTMAENPSDWKDRASMRFGKATDAVVNFLAPLSASEQKQEQQNRTLKVYLFWQNMFGVADPVAKGGLVVAGLGLMGFLVSQTPPAIIVEASTHDYFSAPTLPVVSESLRHPTVVKETERALPTQTPPAPEVLPVVGAQAGVEAGERELVSIFESVTESRAERGVWVGNVPTGEQLRTLRETIATTEDTRAEEVVKLTISSKNPPSEDQLAMLVRTNKELIFKTGLWKLVGNMVVCDDVIEECKAEGLLGGMGENARARGQYQRNGTGKIWIHSGYLANADNEMIRNTIGHEIWHAITPTPDNWWVLAYFKPDEAEWLLTEYDKITNLYREEARGQRLYNPYWGGESSDEFSREVVEQHFWVEKWLQYNGLEKPSYYYAVSPELQQKFDVFFGSYSGMIKNR